ncbi:uncharacterized protein F4812DRAFT_208643 [Daldinia caldariorum]|uniref:uncharacterized protein n=1 Tax=Daldinia caldariorum TaxID=326644 RepID=UPI00200845C4|nr:uncharacterized protein F4812DRAFT_208643 [Daldinia caldariorum]KAI1464357.1 hypothetical protein F4812DRAFT_208643 [Daldinia caldariorum]
MPAMLRLLRSRPNILSLASRVNRSNPASQTIHVHRVNVRRKWFKPMNFIFAGCIYYMCFQLYTSSLAATVSMRLQDEEEEEDDEDEELDPFFIPLPFTTKMVPSKPYRSTDPEWEAFIKVNKDREKVRAIQSSLANFVRTTAARNPVLIKKCGGDMQLGRYWLDVQYPSRPPPTYVRRGVVIADDGIYVTEEPVDTTTVLRVQRALWPDVLALSLWSFSGELLKQNASNFARLFGYNPTSHSDTSFQQAIEKLNKSAEEPDSKTAKSLSSSNIKGPNSSSVDPASPVQKRSTAATPDARPSEASSGSGVVPIIPDAEPGKPKSAKDMYGIKMTQEHTSGPLNMLKQTFVQTWRPIRGLPPRGAIYVAGLVEIITPRAIITVDVASWWDPKTEKFDMKTTDLRLKMLRMKTQRPVA